MHQSSGRDRRARRPAVEQCEHRILQSITVEPVGGTTVPVQHPVGNADGSPVVVLQKPTQEHASGIFDDPFFFDPN